MRNRTAFAAIFASIILHSSCDSPGTSSRSNGSPLFQHVEVIQVLKLTDERKPADLLPYLSHPDSLVVRQAALAFASIRDSSYCDTLSSLLHHHDPMVRSSAVYALGQTAARKASEILERSFAGETESMVVCEYLQAVGKTSGNEGNKFFYQVDPGNEQEKLAWAKGVAWYFYRGYSSDELMTRMPYMLYSANGDTKAILAIAMSRYKGNWFNENEDYLTKWVSTERDPSTRSSILSMFGKMSSEKTLNSLISYAVTPSEDDRVKVNAVRALGSRLTSWKQELLPLFSDASDNVVMESLALAEKLHPEMTAVTGIATSCSGRSTQIRAESLRLAFFTRNNPDENSLITELGKCKTRMDSVFVVGAMGCTGQKHAEFLLQLLASHPAPALLTATADALVEAHGRSDWPAQIDFISVCREAIATGDPGVIAIIAVHLREKEAMRSAKNLNTDFLKAAMEKLELPKEIETYNEIISTLNAIDGTSLPPVKPTIGHFINWDEVKKIPANQQVKITTEKGEIVLELNVEESPGSVLNFLSLADEGFFNGKIFHRVVPNFVVQAGCPRGDGWGSTDYCIRSEFVLHDYRAGTIGMASAGPDTESCQWFITHVPTLFLEGRYTIFGYVTSGLDVVGRIAVGDTITSIERI